MVIVTGSIVDGSWWSIVDGQWTMDNGQWSIYNNTHNTLIVIVIMINHSSQYHEYPCISTYYVCATVCMDVMIESTLLNVCFHPLSIVFPRLLAVANQWVSRIQYHSLFIYTHRYSYSYSDSYSQCSTVGSRVLCIILSSSLMIPTAPATTIHSFTLLLFLLRRWTNCINCCCWCWCWCCSCWWWIILFVVIHWIPLSLFGSYWFLFHLPYLLVQ